MVQPEQLCGSKNFIFFHNKKIEENVHPVDLYQTENGYLHEQPPQANMLHFALYYYQDQ